MKLFRISQFIGEDTWELNWDASVATAILLLHLYVISLPITGILKAQPVFVIFCSYCGEQMTWGL